MCAIVSIVNLHAVFRPRYRRGATVASLILLLLLLSAVPVRAQIFGIRVSQVFVTAMPTWIYNGFTTDSDGRQVQGSDVSPIRFSLGGGFELRLNDTMSIEPEAWLFMQEYIALNEYDKTVPTQIETGGVVGDIANTIGLALAVPWVYTIRPEAAPGWEFDGSAGLALIFRIPIAGVDGSEIGPVARYWIAGRFIYPYLGLAADYRFTERLQVGAGIQWYVPIYNIWAREEESPFLDETMLRYGLRVRWDLAR
ncbi:MAG: hypothetical protein MI724_08440 [Spirochaetales bacterium]|nr:hypothetical protein [Spirochaetales bacterium]